MPYGIYKKGEEIRIYYSACDKLIERSEECGELLRTCSTEIEAKFFAKLERDKIKKYKENIGLFEER